MPNFKKVFNERHKAAIQKDLGLANVMEIPKMEKITINMGLGEALQNSKLIESGVEQLKIISGQMPVVRHRRTVLGGRGGEGGATPLPRRSWRDARPGAWCWRTPPRATGTGAFEAAPLEFKRADLSNSGPAPLRTALSPSDMQRS